MENTEEPKRTGLDWAAIGFMVGMSVALIIAGAATRNDEENAYKQGQIDCQNGTIKYKLIEQPDKTTTWEEIK